MQGESVRSSSPLEIPNLIVQVIIKRGSRIMHRSATGNWDEPSGWRAVGDEKSDKSPSRRGLYFRNRRERERERERDSATLSISGLLILYALSTSTMFDFSLIGNDGSLAARFDSPLLFIYTVGCRIRSSWCFRSARRNATNNFAWSRSIFEDGVIFLTSFLLTTEAWNFHRRLLKQKNRKVLEN